MKGWRVVKITLIAFLLLANVFMLWFLQSVFRSAEYLPEDTIRQARELLRSDGIVIGQRVVDPKKVNLPIYEGSLAEDYHASVAAKLSGSNVSLTFDAPNGVVISMENGDRFMFSDGFDIRYTAGGSPEFSALDYKSVASLPPLTADEVESARKAVTSLLARIGGTTAERGQKASHLYTFTVCGRDDEVIVVALYQGLRRGEVLGLTKDCVNFDKKTITINKAWSQRNKFDTTKNDQSVRTLPMFENTYNILIKYKDKKPNERIFDLTTKQYELVLEKVRKESGLNELKMKDMRSTFITNCMNMNIPVHIIQAWVGHALGSVVTTSVYTSHNEEADVEYINQINEKFKKLT